MAKVKFVSIPPGLEAYFKNLPQASDRFVYSTVRLLNPFTSRKKRAGLTQKSQLPLCSQIWQNFTQEVRDDWVACGLETGLTGFRFFVQDKVLRLKNFLSGESTPSLLYQSNVGRLHVESPASSLKITQLHPENYFVLRKKTGKATMYSPVRIIEEFALPLTLTINYKSNLTAVEGGYSARYYAIVYSLYQGQTFENICEIQFDLISDWKTATVTMTKGLGQIRGYALFMEFDGVRGDVWFDNVKAIHSGQNWCRDTYCNNIKQSFTKQFFQVPAHWVALDLPSGSYYNSEYGNLT
jgi:hypothetical protein